MLRCRGSRVRHAVSREDLESKVIFGVGWSLGAASVADLATRHRLAGLVLLGAVTNLSDGVRNVARNHPPLAWIPDRWLAGSQRFPRLDNEAMLRRSDCPVLVICGASDAIISPEMTRRLASAAGARSSVVLIEGAGHFDLFPRLSGESGRKWRDGGGAPWTGEIRIPFYPCRRRANLRS